MSRGRLTALNCPGGRIRMECGPASSEEAGIAAVVVGIPWHRDTAPFFQGGVGEGLILPILFFWFD